MILKLLFSSLFIFASITSYTQLDFPTFGEFSPEEISMKDCSFDPEAEAVILLDKAVAAYDEDYRLITNRRVRIKILNSRGLSRADISIPFYSKDNFEYISNVQAITYNFGDAGQTTSVSVDKKSFFTEKKDNYYSLLKFAMPAVKPGSIIEYHYTSTMKHYGGLEQWVFQSDLPTMKSGFLLEMLPRAEFAYRVQKKKNIPIQIKPSPKDGMIYFEMNNIPALRFEPYMDAARDYLQKVTFQFSGYLSNGGDKLDVDNTWKKLALDLSTEKDFGSQLDKDLKAEEIKLLTATENSATGKLKVIYEYVKKNIGWNGYDGKYAPDGLKAVWERKKGSAGEINLLLVNLLNSSGIESYPLLVAERDFGKADTSYPFIDRFNKTVAYAIADGKEFILDATQPNCPAGLTPYPLLGTTGFLVDKKDFRLIHIAPGGNSYRNNIVIAGTLDSNGLLSAETRVQSFEYARQFRLDEMKKDKRKFVDEYFEKPYEALTIDSFMTAGLENDSLPFEQIVHFKQHLNESNGYIFINCNLFSRLEKNPFTSSIRFTNVNFGFPFNIAVNETFQLPSGSKVDLPQNKKLVSDDKKIEVVRQASIENDEVRLQYQFVQATTLIPADNYNGLKEFYKKMVEMLNEPVVVKVGN